VGRFTREELEGALGHYESVVNNCSRSREWAPFADLFTEDVTYIEHAYGTFHGREQVREWIVAVMAPFPQMRLTHEWIAYDEENDAISICVNNVLDHPTDQGVEFSFPNLTRLVYAGEGVFSSQEDVYNPARDAPRVVGEWLEAGGQMRSDPSP